MCSHQHVLPTPRPAVWGEGEGSGDPGKSGLSRVEEEEEGGPYVPSTLCVHNLYSGD